ncbi:MAG: anti-sigma factor family protein [Gammaproteobacteria bacterium]
MLTCKEASQLASKALDARLTGLEKLSLGLHLAICSLCRRYVRDLKKLRAMIRKAGNSGSGLLPESVKLSEQSRERIKQVLNKALNQSD